ncbi:hypothetical protein [Clostridium senegalense]|uniref:hypothetical protein n=1 Tax=Clostridium senegalense TaxID=1465809 RepID=UPI001C10B1F4|nr:hypothetical protein [Clostridium senegalense]MBU5225256.1 hypothetical protein [Clostridium senegalense]
MNNFEKLIFVFVGGILLLALIGKIEEKDMEKKEELEIKAEIKRNNKNYIMKFTDSLRYISGFKDKGKAMLQSMILMDNEIQFVFSEITKIIKADNIKNIYVSNEEDISEKMPWQKAIIFNEEESVKKHKKKMLREFIMIECIYNNYETTVIIEGIDVESKVYSLRFVYM